MAGRRRKRHPLRVLVIALLLLVAAVALVVLVPRAIDSSRATQVPTPGQVILPPTAPPAATATVTATRK